MNQSLNKSEMQDVPVALVTGASRGIGAGIARKLASDGYLVVINYRTSSSDAELVKAQIENDGNSALLYKANVADESEVNEMICDLLTQTGRIDALVNNAGISRDHLVASMPTSAWRDVMEVNFGGAFNCTQAVIRPFARRRFGRIVNISSIMSQGGWKGQANYAASKAALNAFTKVCAVELARFGVTTNAVLAGMVPTDLVGALVAKNDGVGISRQIPARRFGKVPEVASAVSYLLNKDNSYTNGALLTVDGGMSSQLGQGGPL